MSTRGEPGSPIGEPTLMAMTAIKAVVKVSGLTTTAATNVGMKKLRCIALDVVQWLRDKIIGNPKALHSTNTWKDITDTGLPVLVITLSQTHDAEMRREIAVIILVRGVHVCLDVCLKNGYNVNVLCMLDHPKEGAALLMIIVEEAKRGLKMVVQEIGAAEIENVKKSFHTGAET
jgi:hypothetical protein